jgi:2-polyprenyl-3-methyl-5-hydroxy-6-metoxy-1,4-benzoquinol methylase
MKTLDQISGYRFPTAASSHSHAYLLPTVTAELARHFPGRAADIAKRVFDLGCGNGSVAGELARRGYEVQGVDPSTEGIAHANQAHPALALTVGSAYDDLSEEYGQFPAVISLEVVEHLYAPRDFAATLFSLVETGGIAVVSTPYHGYLKNLALAASGKLDAHFTSLWDHGHIKFWSVRTLGKLLRDAGFSDVTFRRVGRVPAFAKSMIAIATKNP